MQNPAHLLRVLFAKYEVLQSMIGVKTVLWIHNKYEGREIDPENICICKLDKMWLGMEAEKKEEEERTGRNLFRD